MPGDPTDLDALMQAYRDLDDEKFHDTIEALRARLAPTTHADDEVAIDNLTYAAACGDHIATRACVEGLRRRLAELRARAEAAERALAECRAKTIDECAALIDRWDAPENAANLIRKLKTKEPRDA